MISRLMITILMMPLTQTIDTFPATLSFQMPFQQQQQQESIRPTGTFCHEFEIF